MNSIIVTGFMKSDPVSSPDSMATRCWFSFSQKPGGSLAMYAIGIASTTLAGLREGACVKIKGKLQVTPNGTIEILATYLQEWNATTQAADKIWLEKMRHSKEFYVG